MKPITVNLALQGGGAHGAFTWGVLDRMLEEEWINIDGVSATSAGAMNAAALKSGWTDGERQGARDKLDAFWEQVGDLQALLPEPVKQWFLSAAPNLQLFSTFADLSASLSASNQLVQIFSPYDNPFYQHPLEGLVRDFDYECICAETGPKLFINTTRVSDGRIKVFKEDKVTPEAILASACLPTLYRTIEIFDDETGEVEGFWDGGYMGNPALFPLRKHTDAADTIIVHINPLKREGIPRTVRDIQNRVNEISFNSSLFRELRAINDVQDAIEQGELQANGHKHLRYHSIADDETMQQLSAATKLTPTLGLLGALKEAGREAMQRFLDGDAKMIGIDGTCRIHEGIPS